METSDFWAHVATGDGCWEWTRARNRRGYGVVNLQSGQVKAHRLAWELTNGPIPAGRYVLHSCDNPPCVRPDHLRIGSLADNNRDARERGHHFSPFRGQDQRGALNHYARLTEEQVAEIRALYASGVFQRLIAARFGITQSNVSHIVRGKTWN